MGHQIAVVSSKAQGPSLPFLSSTEPRGTPDRHATPKAQLASSPLLSLSLLSCTERPPDRHGVIQSSVGLHPLLLLYSLHRHCYRYRCCHLQSCMGHQIATVLLIVQLAFITTIIIIVVVIYRAIVSSKAPWAFIANGSSSSLLSLLSSTKPRGPPDRHGTIHNTNQLVSSPPLSLSLFSCTERPPDRDSLVQSPVGL